MDVVIYCTDVCPYCVKAKEWFDDKGIEYREIKLDNQLAIAKYKIDCPGTTTVPQIIINDELIGGYDELMKRQVDALKMINGDADE